MSYTGTELPFPDTENPAGKGFLIGSHRPQSDIPQIPGNVSDAATPDVHASNMYSHFWPTPDL